MAEKKGFDVSTIEIEKIIVHTIPKHRRDRLDVEPSYSEAICNLTPSLGYFFKDKIVAAFSGTKFFRISFDERLTSPVKLYSDDISIDHKRSFVENSKKMAKHLFEVQAGNNNEGILVVIEAKINNKIACIMIKLEMDKGAQLVLDEKNKFYDIKEVKDLMLTQKTKIYKVVLLISKIKYGVQFDGLLMDFQIDIKAKKEVTTWFMSKFLGCRAFDDPKIVTQHFFNYTRAYINSLDDDIKKAKYFQDLNSYIQKNTTMISPSEFAEDYLQSSDEKNGYRDYLLSKNFRYEPFMKEISQIEKQIKKVTIEFYNDVKIIGTQDILDKKVKLSKQKDGKTKVEIISRVKKFG